VAEILDSRIYYGKLQYLISWKGFDVSENSWEIPSDPHANPEEFAREQAFHLNNPDRPRLRNSILSCFVNPDYHVLMNGTLTLVFSFSSSFLLEKFQRLVINPILSAFCFSNLTDTTSFTIDRAPNDTIFYTELF